MTAFPELTKLVDKSDLSFTVGRKKYDVCPTAAAGLRAQAAIQNELAAGMPASRQWEIAVDLMGGRYNTETGEITGGVAGDLIKAGASYAELRRVVMTVFIHAWIGPEPAEQYYKDGVLDLGKVMESQTPTEETPKEETDPDAETD
ncbi:DUF7426 family protein [Corynebacterium sp. TAE3-ERU16]|uniref:DUF7426 family protein n=1 Tax=Corynebacterium sp. TAE3-ERU16 TaxID=2849493 RepID=UPI001C43C663|nr:hypothetical protein [Corynebacterium sp. TAE3-ERU16]MBV7292380.1 hypothetical protein [Corynebacterium sp. TAE3-ERU16]